MVESRREADEPGPGILDRIPPRSSEAPEGQTPEPDSEGEVISPFRTRISRTECEIVTDLLSKVKRVGECLECHLAPVIKGYCYTQVGGRQGIKWRVHRLIWHVCKGPIPEGLMVLHSCDNRKCINLEHLSLGTAADNSADMIRKDRHSCDPDVGERRKFQTAEAIYPLFKQGLTRHDIATRLGISPSTVWNYTSGIYRDYLLAVPSWNLDAGGVG